MKNKLNKITKKQPRTKPAEVRLNELINAAEQLFLKNGVEKTSINEIVELAKVAKGTFYHYFKSKNELLMVMRKRYTNQFLNKLEEAVNSCDKNDWIAKLCTWINVNIKLYIETYHIHDIVYRDCHHNDRNSIEKNKIINQLLDIINSGIKAKIWDIKEPNITALLIYSGVHGATDEAIANPKKDYSYFSKTICVQYLRMLGVNENKNIP